MDTLAGAIIVWGMSAIVLLMPTGLVIVWALCRTPDRLVRQTARPFQNRVRELPPSAPRIALDGRN